MMHRDTYGAFVGAVFGQSAGDLNHYMEDLNAKILAFDAWVQGAQVSPGEDQLGQSFFGGWHSFLFADPPQVTELRPSGWAPFYIATFPSVLPGQVNAALWSATAAYEREFARYYDIALAAGASPPYVRPEPAPAPGGQPAPPAPPKTNGGKVPPPKKGTLLETGAGVGVLFVLAGAALYLAGRRE